MASKERLIDANRAKDFAEMCFGDVFMLTAVQTLLDKCPTADAVPVVHGQWIGEAGYFQCSVCREYSADGGFEQTRFCPNCGAKMDGDGNG